MKNFEYRVPGWDHEGVVTAFDEQQAVWEAAESAANNAAEAADQLCGETIEVREKGSTGEFVAYVVDAVDYSPNFYVSRKQPEEPKASD